MMLLGSSLAITLPVYIYIALALMKIVLVKMRQLQFILGINVQTFVLAFGFIHIMVPIDL